MTASRGATSLAKDDQAARLRELVARLDRARDERTAPPPPVSASANGHRPERDRMAGRAVRSAHVIAMASGKGGVGKTSLSVNLCAVLARRGWRIILLDGDFGLANADLLLGVRVSGHLGHVLDGSRTLDDVLIDTPAGFRLAPGASGVASMLTAGGDDRREMIEQLARMESGCDLVVIDCGAGLGEGVIAFLQAADTPILITTPEPTAIADVYALLKRYVQTTRLSVNHAVAPQLVVNMCHDERDAVDSHRRVASVAKRFLDMDTPLLGWAPVDSAVSEAVRSRSLFVVKSPRCDAARGVRRLADTLERDLGSERLCAARGEGFWRRLFGLSRMNQAAIGQLR